MEGEEAINNGDGLCYLDGGELKGIRVNHADGKWLVCNEVVKIKAGTELYRNYDRCFILQVEKNEIRPEDSYPYGSKCCWETFGNWLYG